MVRDPSVRVGGRCRGARSRSAATARCCGTPSTRNSLCAATAGLRKATDEAVDPTSRQLHTGDLGEIDGDGYLRITGRKKDLIITAGGENVAPTPIENVLCSLIPRCGHVVLIGDRKKYLAALVAPSDDTTKPPSADDVAAALATYNISHAKSRAQTVQEAACSIDASRSTAASSRRRTMKVKAQRPSSKPSARMSTRCTPTFSGIILDGEHP